MSKITLIKSITTLFIGFILAGCGGGGSSTSGGTTPATTSLSGTAAVGFALSNGTVNIKCASSTSIASSTTSASGAIQTTLSGQTLPCAIQVTGGTINGVANTTNYHSIATSAGNVNVTPLTDLLIANLAGTATPSSWFASLTTAQLAAITAGNVTTATTNVKTALGLATQLAGIDPITTAFTPTNDNVMDNTLEALQAAITSNGTAYASLLNGAGASAHAGFTTPAGFNSALTSAYVAPAGGSGVTPCASTHYSVPVHAPTATELAVYAKTYTGNVGNFGPNIGDPFVASGSAAFILSTAGGLTYNGATKLITSMCLENTPTTGAPLYIEMQPSDHVDFFTDSGFTGSFANGANFDVVRGGSCTTTCGSGGGGTTPTVTGLSTNTGPVGTTVTITGTNLVLGFPPAPTVKFGTTNAGGPYTNVSNTGITFTVPTGLAAGTYTVTIGGMSGTPLTVGTFTVTAPVSAVPAVPVGLTATAVSSSQVDLSWTAAANATGYNIYRANAAYVATSLANKITATPITGTTYNDTGLTAGTTYFYRVAAVNTSAALQSMGSVEVSATTSAAVPATPVGIQMGGSRQGVAVNLTVGTAPAPFNAYSYYSGATVFAGSGTIASTNGTGLLASFSSPSYITTDGISLFVTEPASIRKIDIASGAVVTFATVNAPANGITTDGTNVYVASAGWGIQQVNIATGVVSTIPLIQYSPTNPTGVNLNCGYYGMTIVGTNLYCISGANSGDGIQVVDISNTATRGTVSNLAITNITAMIGGQLNGSTITFRGLVDLTTDGTNLFVTRAGDIYSNPAIDKIVISTGVVSTIAGGGPAGVVDNNVGTSASFTRPYGITTDGTSLFVVDRSTGGGLRKVNIQTTAVTGANVGFGNFTNIGGPNLPTFTNPRGITTDGKNVYTVDSNFGSSGTPKIIKLQ